MKKHHSAMLLASLIITAGACATGYHRVGLTGGYLDSKVDDNTYSVVYRGNAYVSQNTLIKYLLYRCAEITIASGNDYFLVVGGEVEEKITTNTTPGEYSSSTAINMSALGANTYGTATTTGTYEPPKTQEYRKYKVSAVIKVYKGETPRDNPKAVNAKELLKILEPHIRKQ